MTIKESIPIFEIEQELKGNTPKTIRNYREIVTRFADHLKDKDLEELTFQDVNNYHLHLRKKGISNKSIQTYIRHIKFYIKTMYEQKHIKEKWYDDIKVPKANKVAIEIMSDDEINTLFSSFDNSTVGIRNKAICMLFLDSGPRKSEIEQIRLKDINFDEKYIVLRGKGNKQRIVPFGLNTKKALLQYMYKRTPKNPKEEMFFLDKQGHGLSSNVIKMMFQDLKMETGIIRLHAHLLRHTFATNFLINDLGDIYQLSRLLGHTSSKTTEIYLNIAANTQFIRRKKGISYLDTIL
ncbi:tyrosine-type recombinase/integrase [Anaerotalea alkaliphila]|uniref:Tyrosine-type recombinase/integrase n=1 Tax=Anaerotalea alkaliphila TaxID=2662126 RepID=A0A7X5KM92_9FIRM|nr:tyrosine-type recombinase/integrase [Anaerotalea alkaliphila]NDL67711.1 tyrosine-type recombinase/integrase [Anaerotalea alkaliphila]